MAIMAFAIRFLTLVTLFLPSLARGGWSGPSQHLIEAYDGPPLQTNVTWDKHSLFVGGQRILFYSGEFHPFRLPVPSLWLDVLQKIRAMGFTGVSFYVDWALLEGRPGEISMEGVFALEPLFEAATKAGVYLLARPGPYINAEVSGGGFPGWLQRINGTLRTRDREYLSRTDLYVRTVGRIIAKAQITNGGPVILLQPENEYTHGQINEFPDPVYMDYVKKQYRDAGIVVPFVSNDASANGNNVPGKPGALDIYGHDGYPLGFDCSNPEVWPPGKLPTDWFTKHMNMSPTTPYSIPEFQGGSFDPWGGPGFETCAKLINTAFQRVFWKNNYSFGVTLYNIYMIFGGTNWGNLGHPGGYTSYDYGAVIKEDRVVSRDTYSEAKLHANFLAATPSFLTAVSSAPFAGGFVTTKNLTVTHMQSRREHFLIVRHTDYASTASTPYKLLLGGTTAGSIVVPQASGDLVLHGRDSKIFPIDYDLFGIKLVYSTAEIFTVQRYDKSVVLVVYGGPDEQHELAVALAAGKTLPKAVAGKAVNTAVIKGNTVLSWKTADEDRAVKLGPLTIWILSRQSAYKYWVLDVPTPGQSNSPYTATATTSVIVKGGYLMRTARVDGKTLVLTGDVTETTEIQVIAGAPSPLQQLLFNGQATQFRQDTNGIVRATLEFKQPAFELPDLKSATWNYIDSLPELQPMYKDAAWTKADYNTTSNSFRKITTPTNLYSSEYGYHTGTLVYRGRFRANGQESNFTIRAQGGYGFGFSTWINGQFLGSFKGVGGSDDSSGLQAADRTFTLPKLRANGTYAFTVVVDNMGLDENWVVGKDDMKAPRGILDYNLAGHAPHDISWILTGNFGGESYLDKVRGPLNEGGMWAERQGFHLPMSSLDSRWAAVKGGPMVGIPKAGIAWYTTSFDLRMPAGYDIPLAFQFTNTTSVAPTSPANATSSANATRAGIPAFRVQLFVNGWQYGKYINHLGPQTKFPVPEGIWDYQGKNHVAMSLWAMEASGARVQDVKLVAGPVVQTGFGKVTKVESPGWVLREGAY